MRQLDDTDITTAVATLHPDYDRVYYERVIQDGRIYYRMHAGERPSGALTDAEHARETIIYWRAKGWIS